MKEFDEKGLRLAKTQGNIFVESLDRYKCSSSYFVKRYMNSEICYKIDKENEINVAEVFDELENIYKLDRGNIKINTDTMYWMGYIYRYWAYVFELSSKEIYKIISGNELAQLFEPYHTLDPELAIRRIYEERNIKPEKDLLQILKRIYML